MKKLLGYLVLSLPFLLLFVACVYFNGIVKASITAGLLVSVGAITFVCAHYGYKLLNNTK